MTTVVFGTAYADVLPLDTALQNTYLACFEIDDNLNDIKKLAGINTAVTGVGTGLGVGATVTGFVKAKTDKEIEGLEKKLAEIRRKERNGDYPTPSAQQLDSFVNASVGSLGTMGVEYAEQIEQEIKEKNIQSKKLGNWRTGLLAGNTATNVAGAIISSRTINKDDIQGQIDACISATKKLNDAIVAAKLNGEDVSEAKRIYNKCREYEFVDVSPIIKRGKGAMIASSTGAVIGGVGTITSGIANSQGIRNDNSESGKKKEKDLNTATNVLAVGATAASATATVFNATQIAAVKKVASVAGDCTEVLR
jgi:hypothetical protein